MRMNKNTILGIIGVLLIVDITAGLTYWAGTLNSDGKWQLFEPEAAAVADTVPAVSRPDKDKFQVITDYAYHQSAADAAGDPPFTCITYVALKWPVDINGNNGLGELKEALLEKTFNASFTDVKEAIDSTLAKPVFTQQRRRFTRVKERPVSKPRLGTEHYYRCYPHSTSDLLLEYKIVRNDFNGMNGTHETEFVHYDRARQQLLTIDMVLNLNHKDAIVRLVNERIQHFIDDKEMKLYHARSLPQEFYLGMSGIVFVFPEGVIAPQEDGVIEIKVDYDKLSRHLTAYYAGIIRNNKNYKELPELPLK